MFEAQQKEVIWWQEEEKFDGHTWQFRQLAKQQQLRRGTN